MDALTTALRYELLFLLTALMTLIAYRLLTRQINTKGLLDDKTGRGVFSPARLQMLIVTLGIAIYYVAMVLKTKETGELPHLPKEFLLALGGSHLFYLGGKVLGLVAGRLELAATKIVERSTKTVNGG
jgi:hypothetical protein